MFVFIDEAGDTGLKLTCGSSKFFTVAMILFVDEEDMRACDRRIGEVRKELGKRNNFEFHFHDNNKRIREVFLSAIAPFGFIYYVLVLRKDPEKMWSDAFSAKESLYKMIVKSIFESARSDLKDAYVVIDKSGPPEFQHALAKYIKGVLNTPQDKVIRKFRAERSSQNNLLQLADYVASICHRKAAGKPDADIYYRTIFFKEKQWKRWQQ